MPVIRPDINGKMVTRHVIADNNGASSAHIPAPAATPRLLGSKEYARRIADALMSEEDDNGRLKEVISEVYEEGLSLHALRELHERLPDFSVQEKSVLREQSYSLFNYLIQAYADEEHTEKVFYGVAGSLDTIGAFATDRGPLFVYECIEAALREADEMGIDPRSSSDYERSVYRFLFFKEVIGDYPRVMQPMEIYEKSVWFAENKDRLFPHADRIMTSNVDWEWMKELANPDNAASLSEGTL